MPITIWVEHMENDINHIVRECDATNLIFTK